MTTPTDRHNSNEFGKITRYSSGGLKNGIWKNRNDYEKIMVNYKRYCTALSFLALIMIVLTCGCTSSDSTAGSSSGTVDNGEIHSSFAELAGTYVNVDNPASSIILNPYGGARIETGDSGIDTSIYMEMGILKLADGTTIGDYPIKDGTLTYKGMNFKLKA
ncbi:MAG: hypothetical protein Q7T80_07030 [Methanoregula sp.]|nr:hypothetical protein [Methanoregula sp.]